ncbi:MAG: tRNA uridine-5-carboxymethylaminomethyl(34) synthesis GTPase MnmE [Gammaproteobacteria bacterium]|nr:tRNA uridine-5-carboxymethylaminomethyl(34) synthesis GTPase MnmE [Gammaproteobacteria bacterium]
MTVSETIVALATPPGRGGVGVIRISGPAVSAIAKIVLKKLPIARHATFTNFYSSTNEMIDQGIALFFPAPNSFTGEDVLELQGHGSPAAIEQLIESIVASGARLARPGEFSERAFLNQRMDLLQAEAVADLIHAASKQAAKNAMQSLQGVFSQKIYQLRDQMIQLRLRIEAEIDFTEEEIDFLEDHTIQNHLTDILSTLQQIQKTAQQGRLLREGITLVISGEPNVGKSSLLNALSKRDTAIVTAIPGTTRDILREYIQIDGLPIHLIDTAGLRESDDPIEQEGIRRAKLEIEKADLILYVSDTKTGSPRLHAQQVREDGLKTIYIRNKIDLTNEAPSVQNENENIIISLSAQTGAGLELLEQTIKSEFGISENVEGLYSARQRHLEALARAEKYVQQGAQHVAKSSRELLADDLREAQKALNELTGEFTSDDLLGEIFSSFCIGK